MTTERSTATHLTPANHHQESAPMNLDTLARLETQAREAELRHHLDERTLERAADRQRHRLATTGADGPGLLSRLIGRLAPRRVARAGDDADGGAKQPLVTHQSGSADHDAAPPRAVSVGGGGGQIAARPQPARAIDTCTSGIDCDSATAGNRAA